MTLLKLGLGLATTHQLQAFVVELDQHVFTVAFPRFEALDFGSENDIFTAELLFEQLPFDFLNLITFWDYKCN